MRRAGVVFLVAIAVAVVPVPWVQAEDKFDFTRTFNPAQQPPDVYCIIIDVQVDKKIDCEYAVRKQSQRA